jgi:hypothetical protein
MLIVCTPRDGGDNENSNYAFSEISGCLDGAGRSDGFFIRGLGAAAGIVTGFGLPRTELSFLRRKSIGLLMLAAAQRRPLEV